MIKITHQHNRFSHSAGAPILGCTARRGVRRFRGRSQISFLPPSLKFSMFPAHPFRGPWAVELTGGGAVGGGPLGGSAAAVPTGAEACVGRPAPWWLINRRARSDYN